MGEQPRDWTEAEQEVAWKTELWSNRITKPTVPAQRPQVSRGLGHPDTRELHLSVLREPAHEHHQGPSRNNC